MVAESTLFKDGINEAVARYYADGLGPIKTGFAAEAFVGDVVSRLDDLELKDRVKHVAAQLLAHLGGDYLSGLRALMQMLDHDEAKNAPTKMFARWPMAQFVEDFGVNHLEASVAAMKRITVHFSCEFAVRPFLVRYPQPMLDVMHAWAQDDHVDVRRNASEGIRPRLPWGPRLQAYVDDPSPVFGVLERLRKDPEEYVRRSVSNCLNDIAKDHPDKLMDVLERWDNDPDNNTEWIKKRALRTLVKAGDQRALALLGFGAPKVRIEALSIDSSVYRVGDTATVSFSVISTADEAQHLMVDYRVHYVKANGSTKPKVFKLKTLKLGPGERHDIVRRQHLKPISTRRYYAGAHAVDVQVNGVTFPPVEFDLEL